MWRSRNSWLFFYMCVTGLTTRHVGEHFQRLNDTISWYVEFLIYWNDLIIWQLLQADARRLFRPSLVPVVHSLSDRRIYPHQDTKQPQILPILSRRHWSNRWKPYPSCAAILMLWTVPQLQRIPLPKRSFHLQLWSPVHIHTLGLGRVCHGCMCLWRCNIEWPADSPWQVLSHRCWVPSPVTAPCPVSGCSLPSCRVGLCKCTVSEILFILLIACLIPSF